jgi:hypothetical protein
MCPNSALPDSVIYPQMPSATTATMPSIVGTVDQSLPSPQPVLTVQTLLQRMPQIVNPAPAQVEPDCPGIQQWVSANPFWAAVGVGVLALWVFGRRGA